MDLTGVVRTPQSLGSKAPAGAQVAASRCDCWTSASSWRSKGQWKGWHGGPAVLPLPCAGHLASPSSAAWELEAAQVRALGGSWAQRHAPAPGSKTPGGQGHAILGSRWHCFTASVSAEPPVYPLLIRDAILDLVSKSFRWSHVSEPWPNSTVLRSAKSAYCWASVREMKSRRDPPRRRGAFDL